MTHSTPLLGLGLIGALCAAGFLSAQGSGIPSDSKTSDAVIDSWSSWNEKGRAKAHRGEARDAIQCFDRAIEINPSSAMLWMNRGSAFLQLSELEQALIDFDKAVILDPAYPELRLNRGQTRAGLVDWNGAIKDFEAALALAPSSWQFRRFTERKLQEAKKNVFVRSY
jgi:tetratricopeptide (TPR) repeat protein